jgi:Caspase domain
MLLENLGLSLSTRKTLITPVTSTMRFLGHHLRVRRHPTSGRLLLHLLIPKERSQQLRRKVKALFDVSTQHRQKRHSMTAVLGLNDYALIVGVANYDPDSPYKPLRGPPNDCKEFRQWLLADAGVPSANIRTVVWSPRERMPYPSSGDAGEALSRVLKPEGHLNEPGGRRLYLFSASHCEAAADLDADVITADARPPVHASFRITRIASKVRRSGLFEEIVLFVDGCRDRANTDSLPHKLRLPTGPHKTRVLYAFACGYDSSAHERRFGTKHRGVFSKALMEGLRGGARMKSSRITASSLERFLVKRMPELCKEGQEQEPEIYCPSKPFVLL